LVGESALVLAAVGLLALAWLIPHRGFALTREAVGKALRHPGFLGLWRRAPALMQFLWHHFHDADSSWLRGGIGIGVAVGGIVAFVHVLRRLLYDPKLIVADLCLHNTVLRFHSKALWRLYSTATDLASPAYLLPLVGVGAVLFWVSGKRREAFGFLGALVGAGLLAVAIKHLVARPRPPEAAQLLHDSSFPSGHTLVAVAVYGFLVYLILRDEPARGWRWWVSAPLLLLIGAVPLSRVYLGYHWPYDTLASAALGWAWLAILITLFKLPVLERALPARPTPDWFPRAVLGMVLAAVLGGAVLAVEDPQRKLAPFEAPGRTIAQAAVLSQGLPPELPRTSEDAVGGPMEPVALVVLGSRAEIEEEFRQAGWQEAETPSVHGLVRELTDVALNRPDPRGPATPAYFGRMPQDLTFEKPGDPSGSIRRRHHTRFWQTGWSVTPGDRAMWVATASYDAGIKLVDEPYLLTHRIDLHVDRERDLIVHDLIGAGARPLGVIRVTGPLNGSNAAGDHFVTDGSADVLLAATAAPVDAPPKRAVSVLEGKR
jgi:membrane-associated phospholipid phosphatase